MNPNLIGYMVVNVSLIQPTTGFSRRVHNSVGVAKRALTDRLKRSKEFNDIRQNLKLNSKFFVVSTEQENEILQELRRDYRIDELVLGDDFKVYQKTVVEW